MKPSPSPAQYRIHLVQLNIIMLHRKLRWWQQLKLALFIMCLLCVVFMVYAFASLPLQSNITIRSNSHRLQARHGQHPLILHTTKAEWDWYDVYSRLIVKPLCLRNAVLHIFITSAADHRKQRDVIRQTWCSQNQLILPFLPQDSNPLLQCTFLIGSSKRYAIEYLHEEIGLHNDILLGSYIDSYRNLTLKVLSSFYWSMLDCPSQYFLKTDDDCFVNTNVMLRVLHANVNSAQQLYVGNSLSSLEHTRVIRDPQSKWSVSYSQYIPEYYPSYISGTGYLLSQLAVQNIISQSRDFEPFPVEDAYVGVLAEQAGIEPEHSYRFTLINEKWSMCNYMYLVLVHQIGIQKQKELQELVHAAYKQCTDHAFVTNW